LSEIGLPNSDVDALVHLYIGKFPTGLVFEGGNEEVVEGLG